MVSLTLPLRTLVDLFSSLPTTLPLPVPVIPCVINCHQNRYPLPLDDGIIVEQPRTRQTRESSVSTNYLRSSIDPCVMAQDPSV